MTETTTTRPTPTARARHLLDEASNRGFIVEASLYGDSAVITVETTFTPGDAAAYRQAERDARAILAHAHTTKPGTTWGTDSGSVGGHSGLRFGHMRLSRSGVSKAQAKKIRQG